MATEAAMEHAGRTPSHTFRDLRSGRRAQNRTRARMEKYYHFQHRGLAPGDLPPSKAYPHEQQSHYALAYHSPNSDSDCETDYKALYSFCFKDLPVNPNARTTVKYTKREAYEEAQLYPRPPRRHSACRSKDFPKWQKRRIDSKSFKHDVKDPGEWRESIEVDYWEDEMLSDPLDRYYLCGLDWEYWESTEDDYGDEDEGYCSDADEKEIVWQWHKNYGGGWFRSVRPCSWDMCVCGSLSANREPPSSKPRCLGFPWVERAITVSHPRPFGYPLSLWLPELYDDVSDAESVSMFAIEEDANEADVMDAEDADWDVVSTASSEAWTEVDELAATFDSW